MSYSQYPLLFLILASCLASTKSSDQGDISRLAAVHIFNIMPNDSLPMLIYCKTSAGEFFSGALSLVTGDAFHAMNGKGMVYFCLARTGSATAIWPAFLTKSDPNPGNVFWRLKEDGLYVSWDAAKWEKKFDWKT